MGVVAQPQHLAVVCQDPGPLLGPHHQAPRLVRVEVQVQCQGAVLEAALRALGLQWLDLLQARPLRRPLRDDGPCVQDQGLGPVQGREPAQVSLAWWTVASPWGTRRSCK